MQSLVNAACIYVINLLQISAEAFELVAKGIEKTNPERTHTAHSAVVCRGTADSYGNVCVSAVDCVKNQFACAECSSSQRIAKMYRHKR